MWGRFRLMPKSYVGYLAHVLHVSTAHLNYLRYGGYDGTLTFGRPEVR